MTLFEPGVQETRFCPYCGAVLSWCQGHDEHGKAIVLLSRCLGCERSVQDYVQPEKEKGNGNL